MRIHFPQKKEHQILLKSEDVHNNHAVIRALAGLTRYRIATLLEHHPVGLTVSHLAEILGASQSKVSHQLRILKNHDIVFGRQQGKMVTYRLNKQKISNFFTHLT